jgi:hypothetical protein
VTTTTPQTLTPADLESALAAMEESGINPLSKAREAIDELAHELLRPLRYDDMRPSEIRAHQGIAEQAADVGLAAAKRAMIDRLITW